jgi:uncharacterized protein YggE
MKKFLPWFLLLAGTTQAANVAPETPFIHVMGEAKETVPPDEAKLTFSLTGRADTYDEALKSTDARFADLLAYLDAQKISRDNVTSYDINVRMDQDRPYPPMADGTTPPAKPTYIATRDVEILLKDLTQFGGLYDKLLSLQMENGVNAEFKTSKEDAIKKALLLEAAENAKQKAQELCASFGMEVDGVHAISEQNFSSIEDNFIPGGSGGEMPFAARADYAGSGGGGGRQYLGPQTIDCVSDIYVIFTIKPKP